MGEAMAAAKTNSGSVRTKRDIKRALLELLDKKSLDAITMSELARKAQVSRSTLYQHYGNVHEVFTAVVGDFDAQTAPVMTQLECYEGAEPEGTLPFCTLLRTPDAYQRAVDDPRFLDTLIGEGTLLKDHTFYQALVAAGYSPTVALALSVFQINGCFNAVKKFGADEATWREVRDAIDTFICGGLHACQQKKAHQQKVCKVRP